MTAERRMDRLEGGLPPKEGTLLWLAEAHRYRSVVGYCEWLVDRPLADAPLERIRSQALVAVYQALRGSSTEGLEDARQQAARDVAFLVELVIVLNAAAEEMVRMGGLRYGSLFWEMRAISAETRDEDPRDPDRPRPTIAERWARWRANVVALRSELSTKDDAFTLLEGQYLDGHITLFPDTLERWERLREAVDDLTRGDAGQGEQARSTLDVLRNEARIEAEAEAERITEMVRASALDILGDIAGAAAIIAPRLRGSRSEP